jgi:hypothetical protein
VKAGQFEDGQKFAIAQQGVLKLDVTVGHTHLVAVIHCQKQLLKKRSGFIVLRHTCHHPIMAWPVSR